MKRILLLCQLALGAACSPLLHAQVNSSYAIAGIDLTAANTLLAASSGDIYLTAGVLNNPSDADLYLYRTNGSGSVLRVLQLHHVAGNGKLVETYDGGVLLVTYQYEDNKELGIYKFDAALNLLWSKYVPIGAAVEPTNSRIDIVKTGYSDQERYMILCASATFYPQYETSDAAFSLLYLTDHGDLLWHRKYADANRLNSGTAVVRDKPTAIATLVSGTKQLFLLAGEREVYNPAPAHSLFLQLVDESGIIVSPYKEVLTTGMPRYADLVAGEKDFTCSFTDGNTGIAGDPWNVSGMCLVRVPLNLNPGPVRYYWQPLTSENYAMNIKKAANGDYMVGCFAGTGSSNSVENPALLRVGGSNLSPLFYKRYNLEKSAVNYSELEVDAAGFNYLTATVNPGTGMPYPDFKARLIKTDPSGNACGAVTEPVSYTDYQPGLQGYNYTSKQYLEIYDQAPVIDEAVLVKDDCNATGGYSTYQGKAPAPTEEIKVFPNLTDGSTGTIYCSLQGSGAGSMGVSVYSMTGQLVYRGKKIVSGGAALLEIPVAAWASGHYMVRVSLDGKSRQTVKVVKR